MLLNYRIWSVPLDYDAPLNEVYPSYVMPSGLRPSPCPTCPPELPHLASSFGDGISEACRAISDSFYCIGVDSASAARLRWCDKLTQDEVDHLISRGRLRVLVDCDQDDSDASEAERRRGTKWIAVPRSAAEINAVNRDPGAGSHDAINRLILIRYRCEKLGIEVNCSTCHGKGYVGTAAEIDAFERWEATDPPTGPGIQMCDVNGDPMPISSVHPNSAEGRLAMAAELASTVNSSTITNEVDWTKVIDAQVCAIDVASRELV